MEEGIVIMATIQDKQKTPQENLVGKTLCNDEYYIHRVIGHGGMGKVYLAAHTELTVPVALKQARADQPLPESIVAELDALLQGDSSSATGSLQDVVSSGGVHTDRFLREALFLARLHHPALPSLYDYFFEDGYWYLVMDYIPGPTLTLYLRQQGPLPPLEAINYAIQLCDVFDYLHKQTPPIIYRDLKPSNILVTPEGTLMLVDFGIARYFKEGQSNDTTDFGSPGYASPEQYQVEGQTDGRSDLFSLGVLLYEMLSGQRPNVSSGTLSADVSRKDMLPLSAVLSGLITLATRTEPMYRFQSAHTFFLALERAYTLEEQRTYQQRVMLEQAMDALHEDEATIPLSDDHEGRNASVPSNGEEQQEEDVSVPEAPLVNSLDPVQRQKIRQVLQQMRHERREDAELETELATVDEKLGQRASMELSQFTLPIVANSDADKEISQLPQPFRFPARRIIRTSFVVVLVLCLLLASLLTVRTIRHMPLLPQGRNITATRSPHTPPSVTTSSPVAKNGSWQRLPSLPSVQADNTAVYAQVQGRAYIYVNGGYRGAKVSPHYDHHFYRYDIAAAQWETSANTQFPGMVNNAVAVDPSGRLFYTSGYSTTSYAVTSLLYMYSPATDTIQKIVPPSGVMLGFGDSMTADTQGHLYISQGFTQSGASQRAGTGWYRYDIATGQWHVLAPLPIGLGYVVLASESDTSIILIGGATDAGEHIQTNTMYTYNTSSDTWQQVATNAPLALSGSASCLVRPGQIAIIGGYDDIHNKGQDSAWLVDLHTMKWTPLAQLPTGSSVLGAAASDGQGHVFLVRGASDPSQPTSDFWELTVR